MSVHRRAIASLSSSYLSQRFALDSATDLSLTIRSRLLSTLAFVRRLMPGMRRIAGKPVNDSIRQADFSGFRDSTIALARDDKSPSRGCQSYTSENTKELLLDKLHVSYNERADAAKSDSGFAYSRIMNFAKPFVAIVRNRYDKNSTSILPWSGKI